MPERGSYRHGRIVWAYLRSSLTGKRERHPAIILNENDDIVQPENFDPRHVTYDNTIHVIGVSTKHRKYAAKHIPLPFTPQGHPITRLKEDCGAIVGWYNRLFIPDDVIGFGGDVPPSVMARIDEEVREDLVKLIGRKFPTVAQMLQELFRNR